MGVPSVPQYSSGASRRPQGSRRPLRQVFVDKKYKWQENTRSPDLGRWWSVTVLSVQSRTVVMTCQSDKGTRGRRWPAVEGSSEDVFITRRPSHAGEVREAENSLGLIGPHEDFWALWRGGPIRAGPKMNELHCGGTPVSPTLTRCLGCCVS